MVKTEITKRLQEKVECAGYWSFDGVETIASHARRLITFVLCDILPFHSRNREIAHRAREMHLPRVYI